MKCLSVLFYVGIMACMSIFLAIFVNAEISPVILESGSDFNVNLESVGAMDLGIMGVSSVHGDFKSGINQAVDSAKFFSHDPANVEKFPNEFMQYLQDAGVMISRSINAPLKFSFSEDGTITTTTQKVNVFELKDYVTFNINAKGELELVEKSGQIHQFSGDLFLKDGELSMNSGSIDGVPLQSAKNIQVKKGIINLKVRSINGVTLEKIEEVTFDEKTKTLDVTNAKIVGIIGDNIIRGSNVALPNGLLVSGSVEYVNGLITRVDPKSEVKIDGWEHSTGNQPLVLVKLVSPNIDVLDSSVKQKHDSLLSEMENLKSSIESEKVSFRKKIEEFNAVKASSLPTLSSRKLLRELEIANEVKKKKIEEGENLYQHKRDQVAQIESDSRFKRKAIYNDLPLIKNIPNLPKDVNYFYWGNDIVYAGGNGFKSYSTDESTQFPNPTVQKSRPYFDLTFQGGEVIIEPTSETGAPQSLHVDGKGSFMLKNGPFSAVTNGKDFLVSPFGNHDFVNSLNAYDMEIEYKDNNGATKKFEFNTFSDYQTSLSIPEKEKLNVKISKLQDGISSNIGIIAKLTSDQTVQKSLADFDVVKAEYNKLEREKDHAFDNMKRVDRSLQNPNAKKDDLSKKYQRYKSEYDILDQKTNAAFARLEDITKLNPQLIAARTKLEDSKKAIGEIRDTLKYDEGDIQRGFFGEIKTGKVEVGYPDFVANIPVERGISAEYYHESTLEMSNRRESNRASFVRNVGSDRRNVPLYSPHMATENGFILKGSENSEYKVLSSSQTCSDVQMDCYINYQKELVDKGALSQISVPGSSLSWHKGEDLDRYKIKVFDQVNSGMLRGVLPVVKDAVLAQPGDILVKVLPDSPTGYGHTIGIKREINVDGKRFFQLFQGSDPARDPEILATLISETQLQSWIDSKKATVHKWPAPRDVRELTD